MGQKRVNTRIPNLRIVFFLISAAVCGMFSALAAESIQPGSSARPIVGGQAVVFDLEIERGEFVQLIVTDSGLHPWIRLNGPEGQPLREIRGRSLGWATLSHLCRESGRHQLQIWNPSHASAGFPVNVHFRQKRPAAKEDEARLEAETAVVQAAEFRDQWREEASFAAIEAVETAIRQYDSLGDQLELLWTYRLLADLYYRSARDKPALEALNEAVRLSSILKLIDTQSELEASRGLILARSSEAEAEGDALQTCKAALELGRQSDHRPGQAMAFNCLGEAEYFTGNFNEALLNYQKADEIWEKLPPYRETAETALYLAGAYRDVGRMNEAEPMFVKAERLWQTVDDPRGRTLTTIGRGLLAARKGLHQQALELLTTGRRACEASGDRLWKAVSDALLGFVYFQLGEPSIALDHFQQAREGFEAVRSLKPLAEIQMEVGRTYRVLGETEKSLKHFEAAQGIAERIGDRRAAALALQQRGLSLEALGRLEEAEAAFRETLQGMQASEFRSGRAATLDALGRIQRTHGNLLDAEKLHREALELGSAADDSFAESRSLYYLALVEAARGQLDSARKLAEAAIQKVEALRANVDDLNLRASYFATVQDYFQLQVDILMRMHAANRQAGWAARALEAAERARARSLLETLIERRVEDGDRFVAEPLSLASIQQELDATTAVLKYALGPEQSYLWVITRDKLSSCRLPSKEDISKSVLQLYRALIVRTASQASREQLRDSDRLADQILERLAEALLPPTVSIAGRRLLIIPDGALYYLPFAALPRLSATTDGGRELRPLIVDHEMARLPSASAVAFLRKRGAGRRRSAAKSIAILADPVFEPDDPRLALHPNVSKTPPRQKPADLVRTLRDFRLDVQIPRLVSSGFEARAILKLAPRGTGFMATGTDANRSLVVSGRLADYQIVHFATHGLNNPENPNRSGLVLSLIDNAGKAQDGFLRLADIYQLRLPVDLVVLSACDTGLGREVRGEGVMGLVRAFQHAGAQSVLASLWKVEDRAAELLMREFYAALFREGLEPGAALRRAQTRMLAKRGWSAPFYWAAFFLEGSPGTTGQTALKQR